MNSYKIFSFIAIVLLVSILLSCNIEDITEITSIEIRHEGQAQSIARGETFVFQVRANNSTYVTDEAIIKVNGVSIDDNTFTTDMQPQEYTVQAFYKDISSQPIQVIGADGYPKNVLIEDYTGTWCGNCPRVSYAIEKVKELTNRVVPVAIHLSLGLDEDYDFAGGRAIYNEFDISDEGLPNARLDRIYKWSSPEPDHIEEAVNRTGIAPLGLAISSELTGSIVEITTRIAFNEDFNKPLKLVVYLVENGLINDQVNYTPYFGGGSLLEDFEHNDVLRALYTHHLGDEIPANETIEDNIYAVTLLKEIPISVEDTTNLHLVSFVVDATSNEVINVREAAIDEEQEFE